MMSEEKTGTIFLQFPEMADCGAQALHLKVIQEN